MGEDIEKIREELEEVRRLKEELASEIEDVRQKKEAMRAREEDTGMRDEYEEIKRARRRLKEEAKRIKAEKKRALKERRRVAKERARAAKRKDRHSHIPPVPPVPEIDLSGLERSLEHMMEGIGEQVRVAMERVGDVEAKIDLPDIFRVTKRGATDQKKLKEIEDIPAERIAEVISPLGSEDRLRILDYLKSGSKTFNELEIYTGKTGSSLTHHLNPLLDAGYIIKGAVRGTYYVTVEGRLAYRLAQWLTSQVENQREKNGQTQDSADEDEFDAGDQREGSDIEVDFVDEDDLDDAVDGTIDDLVDDAFEEDDW